MTNGRLEKEQKTLQKIATKLNNYPEIFNSYYLYLRAAKKTYSTIDTYISGILRFAHFMYGDVIPADFYKNVNVENIESFLISLETTVKNGQVTRMSGDALCTYWSYLNGFWEFLVKRDYVSVNIISKTTRPKNTSEHAVTFLTKPEIKKLFSVIDNVKDPVTRMRDKTLISIGLKTGMRCSAITNLNVEDIDFVNHCIHTTEKGNKVRGIVIGEQLESLLKEWIEVRNQNFGDVEANALFISQKKSRLSTDAANDILKKWASEAGIKKKLTMHKLRSTLASQSLHSGVPLLAVSKQLGHSSSVTTQRYLGLMDEDRNKLVDYMDNII